MKRILIIMMTIGLLLTCSCGNNKLTTDEALGALLNADNYKFRMSIRTEDTVNEQDLGGIITIFHNPYKSKGARVLDHPDELGIISMAQYEMEKGRHYVIKSFYTYDNGDTKEWELTYIMNEEYTIIQIKDCLLSEEFVGEEVINGTNVMKYKIAVTAYPFSYYLNVDYGKNDPRTQIFMNEYQTCEGYVYINSETHDIQKIEFDLSNKMKLNEKIVEEITAGISDRTFIMPDYSQFIMTIEFFDINDDSEDTKDIEKEIDRVMQ